MKTGLVLLLVHAASTWFMVGLIWFVQVVHYPMFAQVGPRQFTAYEVRHQRLTMLVVAPAMLIELITAAALLWWRPAGVPRWAVAAGLALIAGLWLSTALLQVPQHRALEAGFAAGPHRLLVSTNWLRAVLWSARGALALWMLDLARGDAR